MKQIFSKRWIKILNLALLIVNITALSTLLLVRPTAADSQDNRDIRSVGFLREQLQLTDQQYEQVMVLSERTFRKYNTTMDLLCQANLTLLDEMAQQEPDQEQLRRLTLRIGRMHTNLKNLTVEYFEAVRSICTQEQNAQLASLFRVIMQLQTSCDQCQRQDCPGKEGNSNTGISALIR